jgi:hypothetical protein
MKKYAITFQPYFLIADPAWYYNQSHQNRDEEKAILSFFNKEQRMQKLHENTVYARRTLILDANNKQEAEDIFLTEFYTKISSDNSLKFAIFSFIEIS